MLRIRVVLFLLTVFCISQISFAWGCTGHQTVALIAAKHMSTSAKSHVTSLLNSYSDKIHHSCNTTNSSKMAYYATWADDARNNSNASWHFWDIPLSETTAAADEYCDEGCVVQALKDQVAILKDATKSKLDRQHALLFIIHFAGDVHQPMHIVDNGDRGGNCLPLEYHATGHDLKPSEQDKAKHTESFEPNLHNIWDAQMLAAMTGIEGKITIADRDKKLKTFSTSIDNEFSSKMDGFAKKPDGYVSWALESHKLASSNGYDPLNVNVPVIAHPTTVQNCVGVGYKLLELKEVVDDDYVNQAEPIIRQQLARGGARLAAILNSIWP